MITPGTYALYEQYDNQPSMVGLFTIEADGSVTFSNKKSELNLDFIFPSSKMTPRSKTILERLLKEEDPYHFIRKV